MIFHSVKLQNYKSIGDNEYDEIIIEPRVTAIIGKNESGKSNVVEGLSRIKLFHRDSNMFGNAIANRINYDREMAYIITLKEIGYEMGGVHDTVITITKDQWIATGGVCEYLHNCVGEQIELFLSLTKDNVFKLRNEEYQYFSELRRELNNKEAISIPIIHAYLHRVPSWVPNLQIDQRQTILDVYESIASAWKKIEGMIPTIFFRNDKRVLKTRYQADEVEKELNHPDAYPESLLASLVRIIGISKEDFIEASKSGTTGPRTTLRNRIKKELERKISQRFNQFYSAESTVFSVEFDSGTICFSLQSNEGDTMLLSERSNGIKWYLNLFIDAMESSISDKNVLYLFDEPGTALHVNAQRELIHLFNHLCDNGNQVIYTTHSPYMLDTIGDGIHRIRAVTKDENGITNIYKTAYDPHIAPGVQEDTVTPIIAAIGMNLYDSFGPAQNKINIVTEGVSDYIYIHALAQLLNIDLTRYAIIPSYGASNCIDLCCILHGWGCPHIALFDYDKAGVTSAEKMRNNMMGEYEREYIFVRDVDQEDLVNRTYLSSPYTIEDMITGQELRRFTQEMKLSDSINKTLLAKKFENAILSGQYQIGDECKHNFVNLMDRIEKCCKSQRV